VSAVPSDLCHFSRLNRNASLADAKKKKEESQKIDNLPVLATCRSGTLAILSSKVNGPFPMEAHGNA